MPAFSHWNPAYLTFNFPFTQAFVYLNGASSRTLLQEKTFSVNSIVDHYIANASDLGLGAAEIAVLNAFKAA